MTQAERIRVVKSEVDPDDFRKLEDRVEKLADRVDGLRIWQAWVLWAVAATSALIGFGVAIWHK